MHAFQPQQTDVSSRKLDCKILLGKANVMGRVYVGPSASRRRYRVFPPDDELNRMIEIGRGLANVPDPLSPCR